MALVAGQVEAAVVVGCPGTREATALLAATTAAVEAVAVAPGAQAGSLTVVLALKASLRSRML